MRKIIFLIAGIILGAILTGIIIWNQMPGMMIQEMESQYDLETTVNKLEGNVYSNGWEVTSELDIQEKLANSGYENFLRMKVIEICKAEFTYTIFQEENNKKIAGIMPGRFAVYELENGKVMISMMNTGLLSKVFGGLIQHVMGKAAAEEMLMLKDMVK
jgi:uncharacterized protein (DUF302 family)